jgi:hypothetical protein
MTRDLLAFPKPQRVELPAYRAFVRQHTCVVWKCFRRTQASHIVFDGQGKEGSKSDDTQTVPKCDKHHEEYHHIGRDAFAAKYGLQFERIIIDLLTAYVVQLSEELRRGGGE